MKSMHKNKKDESGKPEVGLGGQTEDGYKYKTKINFKEDLSLQIARLIQEKRAKDELEIYIDQIRKVSSRLKNKKKNLAYYKAVGNILSFMNNSNFENIKPYSVFRRLIDEVPDMLPGLDTKRIQDHLMMMYRIGELDEEVLGKATWEQWYEISKFKNVVNNRKVLNRILTSSDNTSGPNLREKIE